MAAENLTSLAKAVFGPDGVPNLVPDFAVIQKDIEFSKGEALGDYFEMAVRTNVPKGVTFAKGDGTAGAFALGDVIVGSQVKSKVYGYQMALRDWLSNEDAAKLSSSRNSFERAAPFFFEGMQMSLRRFLELQCLYGGSGIADTTGAGTAVDATHQTVAILPAKWAEGIWAGAQSDSINFYSGSTLISSGANAIFSVDSVDFDNKKITVSGTATGITALISALGSGTLSVYHAGSYGNQMDGIHKMLSATSGNIQNIDVTLYSQWKGISYAPASSGPLDFDKAKRLASAIMSRGGLMEGANFYINNKNFDDLVTDIVAVQRDKLGSDKVKVGVKEITFTTSAGDLTIKAHPMVWEGYGYCLAKPKKYWKRVGAADITGVNPVTGGKIFFDLPSNMGIESRLFTHQSSCTEALAKSGYISSLVPTT